MIKMKVTKKMIFNFFIKNIKINFKLYLKSVSYNSFLKISINHINFMII